MTRILDLAPLDTHKYERRKKVVKVVIFSQRKILRKAVIGQATQENSRTINMSIFMKSKKNSGPLIIKSKTRTFPCNVLRPSLAILT